MILLAVSILLSFDALLTQPKKLHLGKNSFNIVVVS